jgi:hypothetical protein
MAQDKHNLPENQFLIELPGVGDFIFRRTTWGDQLAMDTLYQHLVGFRNPSVVVAALAQVAARIAVTAVKVPKGYESHEKFPRNDPNFNLKLLELWRLIEDEETFFPEAAGKPGTEEREADGGDARVLVPEEVQPSPE